jgi:hypothetical protein
MPLPKTSMDESVIDCCTAGTGADVDTGGRHELSGGENSGPSVYTGRKGKKFSVMNVYKCLRKGSSA